MKRYNKKKAPTKAESEWMGSVKLMPCACCDAHPVDCHHITEGFRRLGNWYVLPLCKSCHAKIDSIGFQAEMELCQIVWAKLGREWIEPPTKIVKRFNGM